MQKILSLVLAVVLCLGGLISANAEVDLSGMTLAEKFELYCDLQEELFEAFAVTSDPNDIYEGVYVVGTHIAAGWYMLTATSEEGCTYYLYDSMDQLEEGQYNTTSEGSVRHTGESLTFELKDGMVISIRSGHGRIQTIDKPAWAL